MQIRQRARITRECRAQEDNWQETSQRLDHGEVPKVTSNARAERRRGEPSDSELRLLAVRSSAKLDSPALTSSKLLPLLGTAMTVHLEAQPKGARRS
jgi:hypothetical protein